MMNQLRTELKAKSDAYFDHMTSRARWGFLVKLTPAEVKEAVSHGRQLLEEILKLDRGTVFDFQAWLAKQDNINADVAWRTLAMFRGWGLLRERAQQLIVAI